jgi:putative glycerol-1-phosphate prenyltransferase
LKLKTHNILEQISQRKGQVAILIDPDKTRNVEQLSELVKKASFAGVDYLFVGGSTVSTKDFKSCTKILKSLTQLPIVIFPGSSNQISKDADAILYLSLVSGRNPDYLITHHVQSALELFQLNIEVIPTGYILVDGGKQSAVAYVSQTNPIPREQVSIAVNTALAAQLQGKKLIFFDAGSGAKDLVPAEFITELRKYTTVPIIVGGGIRSTEELEYFTQAGANVCVIGTKIEENIDFLLDLKAFCTKTCK